MGNKQAVKSKPNNPKPPEGKPYDLLIKILILGDTGAGRRTLRKAIVETCCLPGYPPIEFDADHIYGDLRMEDGRIARIQFWKLKNTPNERSSIFIRGADAFIICYNIKDYLTFGNAFKWYQEMERNSRFEGAPTVMVGAQADCDVSERRVEFDQASDRCNSEKLPFFEVSADAGDGIAPMLTQLLEACIKYHKW